MSAWDVTVRASQERVTHSLVYLVGILENAVTAVFSQVEHTKLPRVDAIRHCERCVRSRSEPELTRWVSWSVAKRVYIESLVLTRVL